MVLNGSEKVMLDFSNRQRWHFLTFLLYAGASPTIDQSSEKGAFFSLRSQTWAERVVLWALLLWAREALWLENRCLKVVDAKPMYSFTLFVLETRSSLAFALENTAGFRQLQPLIVLQLSFFFARGETCRKCLSTRARNWIEPSHCSPSNFRSLFWLFFIHYFFCVAGHWTTWEHCCTEELLLLWSDPWWLIEQQFAWLDLESCALDVWPSGVCWLGCWSPSEKLISWLNITTK